MLSCSACELVTDLLVSWLLALFCRQMNSPQALQVVCAYSHSNVRSMSCRISAKHRFKLQNPSLPESSTRCERVSSFLTAHQHILAYLVPYDGENVIKM